MAGNYGGNSLATTPIDGATLLAAKNTTYKNWKCTSVYGNAAAASFTYMGEAFTMTENGLVNLLINPSNLTAADAAAIFLCYECDPCGVNAFTGTTAPSSYYSGPTMNKPTIIGGGGLNN
jgi:hypothetical protein